MNKASAVRYIKARLMNAALEEKDKAYTDLRNSQLRTGDRSEKVRSYNYKENRVSEHRLNKNFQLDQFLNGRLQPAVEQLRLEETRKKLAAYAKELAAR